MPNPRFAPRGAIATEVDVRQWAGVDLFDAGGTTVTAPAGWAYFTDVVDLLSGRGCEDGGEELANLIAGAAAATGVVVTGGITRDDRVSLVFTGATSVTLAAGAGNTVWGFDPAGQTSILVSGNHVLIGVADWQRGVVNDARITLTRGASTGSTPELAYRAQSVPCTLRPRGTMSDVDDVWDGLCLSDLDVRSTWTVDADGIVSRTLDASVSGGALSWLSTSFRDALGFTGAEVPTLVGDASTLTATYPCRWLLTPSRPWENVTRGYRWQGSAVQGSDGSASSVSWLDLDTFDVSGFLDGPADRIDRQAPYLRDVLPYMPPGARVTLYQDWGDTRRALRSIQQAGAGAALGTRLPPYSTLWTAQADGTYGRWLCRRSVDDTAEVAVEWPDRVQRRWPVSFALQVQEGGNGA